MVVTGKIVAVESPLPATHSKPHKAQDQHCKSRDHSEINVVVAAFLQTKLQQNKTNNSN